MKAPLSPLLQAILQTPGEGRRLMTQVLHQRETGKVSFTFQGKLHTFTQVSHLSPTSHESNPQS